MAGSCGVCLPLSHGSFGSIVTAVKAIYHEA